ncbi:hypothetical protein ACI79C_04005 [Geodermatophilus sp. SYSU D00697]
MAICSGRARNAFFAGSAIVTDALWVGLLVVDVIVRRRRDDEEDSQPEP